MDESNKKNKPFKQWIFLLVSIIIYGIVYIFNPDVFIPILNYYTKILAQIIPLFVVVYLMMLIINMYVDNETLRKQMGDDAGIKGWIISIIAGIISMGPIYAWYPMLKDLQQKGVKDKFIIAFLYNRGIKLQWLPVLLLYFGWVYSITLLFVMIVMSVFQGIITEKLIKNCCISSSEKI